MKEFNMNLKIYYEKMISLLSGNKINGLIWMKQPKVNDTIQAKRRHVPHIQNFILDHYNTLATKLLNSINYDKEIVHFVDWDEMRHIYVPHTETDGLHFQASDLDIGRQVIF